RDVVLRAADHDGLLEDVLPHDRPISLDRGDLRAHRGQRPLQLGIGLELVAEAALQSTAHPGELGGVEGQALLLGHLHPHRLELLQPRRAAELAAARADAARRLRLVTGTDGLHLHTGVEELPELAHDAPEVDAILRDAEEGHLAAVEGALRLDQLDRQAAAANQIQRDPIVRPLALDALVLPSEVAGVGPLYDALERTDRRA